MSLTITFNDGLATIHYITATIGFNIKLAVTTVNTSTWLTMRNMLINGDRDSWLRLNSTCVLNVVNNCLVIENGGSCLELTAIEALPLLGQIIKYLDTL